MQEPPLLLTLIGLIVVAAMVLRAGLERIQLPPLVAFMVLGFLIRLADDHWDLLTRQGEAVLELMGRLGVVALLFRVGLESDLAGLIRQLPSASIVWLGGVSASAIAGYLVLSFGLGYALVPSLIGATALTATSVGVSMAMWRKADALRTPNGELLTDVAEMDDVSAVALMALLFALVPVLHAGGASEGAIGPEIAQTAAVFMLKLVGFAVLCVVLARFLERRLTQGFARIGSPAELMVLVAGLGIVIAGLAASLGFSAAIGALFAGIVFSRDPQAVSIDANFRGVYDLLTPFFFVGIGLSITPDGLVSALGTGIVLFVVAAVSKLAGHGLSALVATGTAGAVAVGVSMIPRAEITMVIIEQGQSLGSWAVPDELFAAFVLTSALTCLMAPVALQVIFRRWPDAIGKETKAETSE